MIDRCGISRDAAGLRDGLQRVNDLKRHFQTEVRVPGADDGPNAELEKALRVSDFFGLAQLMLRDGQARDEHQSPDGEALRDDARFAHIAAREHNDKGEPIRHSEPLQFTALQPSTRSYK